MGDFFIGRDELENVSDQGSGELLLNAILIHAEECIAQGGRVIVEERYSNAPSERIEEFTSLDRFREYLHTRRNSEDDELDPLDLLQNDEPDNSIYSNPDTFGTDRGDELDKAFRAGGRKKKS